MIAGIISDTHDVKDDVLKAVIEELKKRKVEIIIHCGDIEAQHVNNDIFLGIPVYCALNAEQIEKQGFQVPPENWLFTLPGKRIIDIKHTRLYLGHKRAFQFITGSEQSLIAFLDQLRSDNDGLRLVFSGHTHHQVFAQSRLVNFINPGAVQDSFDGYEFAVIDTDIGETVFSRIMKTQPAIPVFSIGVISDSLRISLLDKTFWQKLAKEMYDRNAMTIIHCGNIALEDIGRPELKDFNVYYNLRSDQLYKARQISVPGNWHMIDEEDPVVEEKGYRFYVQLDLGANLLKLSEVEMHGFCLDLRRKHPELDYVLSGFTNNALLVEQEQTRILNPGDIIRDRNFAVICLPRNEITFGHVPY